MKSSEKLTSPKKKSGKLSGWKKVTATFALIGALSACDDIPSNQIILNPSDESEKFSLEYLYSGGSGDPLIIDHNVYIHKSGDKFIGRIEKSDGWVGKDVINIESGDIDGFFESVSNNLDSEYITDETRGKKDAKVSFAKQVFKENVLNKKRSSDDEEITINYD